MGQFAAYASRELGVNLPRDYAGFMDTHGNKLSEDPVHKESWIGGLGSSHFVIGTTLAFRSRLTNFRSQNVVIGYVGIKTIIVNKAYEEIDEYLMLDTRDGTVLTVDSLGATNKVAESFEVWVGPELLRATLREKHASNLTIILFDDPLKAEEARLKLMNLRQEGLRRFGGCRGRGEERRWLSAAAPDAQTGAQGRIRREHHGTHRRQHLLQPFDRGGFWSRHRCRFRCPLGYRHR